MGTERVLLPSVRYSSSSPPYSQPAELAPGGKLQTYKIKSSVFYSQIKLNCL